MKTLQLPRLFFPANSMRASLAVVLLTIASSHGAAAPRVYRFISTAANTTDHSLTVDHPDFNGKPSHRLIVSQYSVGVSNPHNVSVLYNHATQRWQIFNSDFEDISVNAGFNVMIAPASKTTSVTPQNLDGGLAFFQTQKNNPEANLLCTHMSNPVPILNGVAQPNSIGLFFIPAGSRHPSIASRWALFQENGEPHVAAAYNILDVTKLKVGGSLISFRHAAVTANTANGETVITNALTDGKPDAVLFVQHFFSQGAAANNVDEILGVRYSDGKWRIFVQDGDDLPVTSGYMVVAFPTVTP
ncbi:hypothetical protein OJ996_04520 [Luteolibacter sp. GHJ8]|uniref:DUF7452 domain-containing protein n=1 Tax=Luteolibacter rhizosphaerae TaxID=2989719 RepID=A0ABT3G011_9BACT|nr:hypothetical protein [Luteolibacter rhizosphaerae]MCW1912824.1 hypothetical protein [Luteolibacter rhizosphaerae]